MKIYNYNPVTGEYLSESIADESPLEPGTYLIPAHATTIEPPTCDAGKVVAFIDGAWQAVEDHRGTTVWHKETREPVTVDYIGKIHNDHTDKECPGPDYDFFKSSWKLNKKRRDERLEVANRAKRDGLLSATDWYVTRAIETGAEIPTPVKEYRQYLRDITNEKNWPNIKIKTYEDYTSK